MIMMMMREQIIRCPQAVQWARCLGIKSHPRFSLATPMQQANGSGVQWPAPAFDVVSAEPVLVPPMVHLLHIAPEHQQEGRERAELIDPLFLLDLHPPLDLSRESMAPPHLQIHHHNTCIEVARLSLPLHYIPPHPHHDHHLLLLLLLHVATIIVGIYGVHCNARVIIAAIEHFICIIGPKCIPKVLSEISLAILRCPQGMRP